MKNYILKKLLFITILFTSQIYANESNQANIQAIEEEISLAFTQAEKDYLASKKQITMCVDPNWMPLEKLEDGKHMGMVADYFKIFQKHIAIPIVVVQTKSWTQSVEYAKQRKCDIFSLSMKTKKRSKYMNFTEPYIDTPLVLATKPNVTFITSFKHLKSEKIGIVEDYAFNEILKRDYPNINIINVKNTAEGLQKVANGELFGLIDTLATIGYLFQTKFTGELAISGKFHEKWELGVAVRNDDLALLNIFQKVVNNLSVNEKQNILNNYIGIKYEKNFNEKVFWQIFSVILALGLVLLWRYRSVSQSNKKIKKYLDILDKNVLITSMDTKGNITYISSALCKLTGYKAKEIIGKMHTILQHQDVPSSTVKEIWDTISQEKTWQGEIKNITKDGSCFWTKVVINPDYNSDDDLRGYTVIRHDITDKKILEKTTLTDALTQIPNRLHLDNNFKKEVERAKRYNSTFSVILMDIDIFKNINDTYGHQVGDIALKELANILKNNIRKLDILGRWGGEEFLIICPQTDALNAEILAKKIKDKIEYHDFTAVRSITCSFGVSQYLSHDIEEEAFQRADKALYLAKERGRNKVVIV